MSYHSIRLHPDFQTGLSVQIRKLSAPRVVLAIATLGGSLLANQHWDLGAWNSSLAHKAIALVESTPIIGGLVAGVELLGINFFCSGKLTPNEMRSQKYFKYMQASQKSVFVQANEHKDLKIQCSLTDHFTFQKAVSTVFFYPKHIDKEIIIKAVQHTLKDFPLFGGVLKENQGQLSIDCNNQGIGLTSVHSDLQLSELLSDFPNLSSTTFVNEVNPQETLKTGSPLLKIKLSYFSDGMAIGYSWHHSVGDMASFMEFLKALSASAKNQGYLAPLLLEDRETLSQTESTQGSSKNTQSLGLKRLDSMDIFRFIKQGCSPTQTIYLYFTDEELESLRRTLNANAKQHFSRNDVLCAHILELVSKCRDDTASTQHASIVINCRPRLGIPTNTLGNLIDTVSLQLPKFSTAGTFANKIHESVQNYSHDPITTKEFVKEHGGIRQVKWIVPKEFLPQYQNLIFTSWANFGPYAIDFGVVNPDLFLPVGNVPLPWVARIVEGYNNQGRLVALTLPSNVAKSLMQPEMLQEIHKYRPAHDQTQSNWKWVN